MLKYLALILLLLFAHTAPAQLLTSSKRSDNTIQFKVSWVVAENNYRNTAYTRSTVTLTNTGSSNIPAKGWKIYFNANSVKGVANDNLVAELINGDYAQIYAGKNFKKLEPGKSISADVITSPIKNITDYPKGFYIVIDDDKTGKTIPVEITVALPTDVVERQVAQTTFYQNETAKSLPATALPPILPTPVKYTKLTGMLKLGPTVQISNEPAFVREALYLKAELAKVFTTKPTAKTNGGSIKLKSDITLQPGAYELQITPVGATIKAANNAGIFYGIQSLKMLLPPDVWDGKATSATIPCMTISDAPRFGYRTFMMDVARNFQPKSEVLKVIDLLSLYKMNVLHLHLNDDEGWRLQIPGLPELTEVAGKRGHTLTQTDRLYPAYGSGPDTTTAFGTGYFTRADYMEILRYANERHIRVIPELETPGHARAAIKAMQARYERLNKQGKKDEAAKYLLTDPKDKSEYRSVQGWSDNVINVAMPSTYAFMEKVCDELIAMYKEAGAPLQTIHFGGDEVPSGVWEKSPAVADLKKKDPTIKGAADLWFYYFNNVYNLLKARNLNPAGWEEIVLRTTVENKRKQTIIEPAFVGKDFQTEVWNNTYGNEDLAYKLANAGFKVVLSNVTNLYLDMAHNENFYEPGQYWGGYTDLSDPFSFIPLNYYKNQTTTETGKPLPPGYFTNKEQLTPAGRANIIGIQAPLWSELITTPADLEYLMVPKILAVAERAWAADPAWATETDSVKSAALYNQAWAVFINKLAKTELPRLDKYAGGFNYRIPTPGIIVEDNMIKANVLMPGYVIRYSSTGNEPMTYSPIFPGVLPYTDGVVLRVFNAAGRGGRAIKVTR